MTERTLDRFPSDVHAPRATPKRQKTLEQWWRRWSANRLSWIDRDLGCFRWVPAGRLHWSDALSAETEGHSVDGTA